MNLGSNKLLLVIIIAIVVVIAFLILRRNAKTEDTVTSHDLFGDQVEIYTMPQVKRKSSVTTDIFRSFNPSLTKVNDELVYVYRVSNALNCDKPLDFIEDKFMAANNPSKSSYIALSNGKTSVDITTEIVGGVMCSKGYEDPRAVSSPNGDMILISASAVTGSPGCRSEMWLLEISSEDYRQALTTNGKPRSVVPQREIKMKLNFDTDQHQKNWMPFFAQDQLLFVYSINPHIILKCDRKTGKCKELARSSSDEIPKNLRGGSQVLLYNDSFIAATHRQLSGHSYVTQFYTFETVAPFRITGITPDFKFVESDAPRGTPSRIQFVAGFQVIEDIAILTYGEQDCYSKECRIPMVKILDAVKPIK